MNTLKEDLTVPLDKVQRWWIRRPSMLIITLLIIPIGVFRGACEITKKWFEDCW